MTIASRKAGLVFIWHLTFIEGAIYIPEEDSNTIYPCTS
jgi:hypothetical protein